LSVAELSTDLSCKKIVAVAPKIRHFSEQLVTEERPRAESNAEQGVAYIRIEACLIPVPLGPVHPPVLWIDKTNVFCRERGAGDKTMQRRRGDRALHQIGHHHGQEAVDP